MDKMLYSVGDQVLIVNEVSGNRWDDFGNMADWCGHIMTIAGVRGDYYIMQEDGGHWSWFPEMIDGLALIEKEPESQTYKVGDRVQITHAMHGSYWSSAMSVWLGVTMTIDSVAIRGNETCVYNMKEDGGEWTWSPHMIAGLSSAPVRQYKVGDRVQIVSQQCGDKWSTKMLTSWLGQPMTIREVLGTKYLMEEDRDEHRGNGWVWESYMIAGFEDEFLFEPASDDELAKLLS